MQGFWERELTARRQAEEAERRRAAEAAERRRLEAQRQAAEADRARREQQRRAADAERLRAQAAERERVAAAERARQAAMARQPVVPPTRVVPEVRQAEQRRDWERFTPAPAPVVFEDAGFRLPTGTPFIRPIEDQPTVEEFAAQMRPAGQLVSDIAFGPEVESVLPGKQEAGLLERFVRTQAGEQEFRTSAQRFGEGRPGAGVGWGLLGLAGAIPFFGDVGRLAGAAGDVARGAERAADVGRSARSADVYQQVSSEISSGGVKFSLPDDVVRQIPEDRRIFAEVLYRQGFSGLPRRITVEDFRRLASDPEYIQVHRGIRGGEVTRGSDIGATIDAEDAAFDLINGDLYIGGGTAGNGIYFTSDGDLAIDFARGAEGRRSDAPGAVVTGFLPRSARIADLGGPLFREYIEETGGTVARTRPFDFSTFAAMRGYDAVRVNDSNYIVLNRSSMLMVDEPGMFLRGSTRLPPQNRERFVAAERAADVGRAGEAPQVVPQNIADSLSQEIRSGGLQYTKPNIENVPRIRRATAEIVYRQGFEAPARSVPSENFDTVVSALSPRSGNRLPFESKNAGKPIVVYRGLTDEGTTSGVDYARSLIDGEYYVGYGAHGHGSYFSEKFHDAVGYSARRSGPSRGVNGAVVRAVVSPEARLLDFSNVEAQRAFGSSGFSNISEFAAASGYDGIIIPKGGMNHVNILNRSVLIFDHQPRVVTIYDLSLVNTRGLSYDQLQDDLFRGASNRKNFELAGESSPPETRG